jgi:hypothetical protein
MDPIEPMDLVDPVEPVDTDDIVELDGVGSGGS